MNDLFPELEGGEYKASAYRGTPGSGPEGERCKTCYHFYRQHGGSRAFSKCGLMSGSHGAGSDISMYSPACNFWQTETKEAQQ